MLKETMFHDTSGTRFLDFVLFVFLYIHRTGAHRSQPQGCRGCAFVVWGREVGGRLGTAFFLVNLYTLVASKPV